MDIAEDHQGPCLSDFLLDFSIPSSPLVGYPENPPWVPPISMRGRPLKLLTGRRLHLSRHIILIGRHLVPVLILGPRQ